MKVRARFSKEGRIKYIGHLDLLRLFQRVIKSANIPIAYSQGFNPHSLLYFAQPLSVGVTSDGEYIDIHLTTQMDPDIIKSQMNQVLPQGLKVHDVYVLAEKSKTAMTLVDAAKYEIRFKKDLTTENIVGLFEDFYSQEEILVTRVSKKKEKTINIKDFIYYCNIEDSKSSYVINVILAAGSRKNLNAEVFLKPFAEKINLDGAYDINRVDLLSMQDNELVSLSQLGE